jgi:hypothetical protein
MKKHVEIGQLYQSVGKAAISWEVAKLVDQAGIPHARLISMDSNRDQRLVACSVVLEQGRYKLLRDVPPRRESDAAE